MHLPPTTSLPYIFIFLTTVKTLLGFLSNSNLSHSSFLHSSSNGFLDSIARGSLLPWDFWVISVKGTPNGFSGRSVPASYPIFTPYFKRNCGRGVVGLWTSTCLEGVVVVIKVTLHVEYFCSIKFSILCMKFHGDYKTITTLRWIWPPSVFGILLDLTQWCLSVCLSVFMCFLFCVSSFTPPFHNHMLTLHFLFFFRPYSTSQGLFVLLVTWQSTTITNQTDFDYSWSL